MKRLPLTMLLVVLLLAFCRDAAAYPYDLYAKYTSLDASAKVIAVKIGTAGELVPGDPTNAKFNGIFLKPKTDDLARMELERLQSILLDVYVGAGRKASHIVIADAQLTTSQEILVLAPTTFGASVGDVRIEVRPKFKREFLCEEEQTLRNAKGKPAVLKGQPEEKVVAPKGATMVPKGEETASALDTILESANLAVLGQASSRDDKEKVLNAYTTLFSRALTSAKGDTIVYSFCAPVYDRINWAAVASAGAKEAVTDASVADATHARHKALLASRLVETLNDSGAATAVRLERHDGDVLPNVYAYLEHNVAILMDTSDLELQGVGSGNPIPLPSVVDQDSQIVLNIHRTSHFCSIVAGCNTVIGSKLKVLMTYVDKDKKVVPSTGPLASNGNGWVVASDLTKYLGQKLSFTVYYAVDGDTRLELLGNNYYAEVEDLGLVTTAPVISDILASAKASSPKDVQLQSSVPVSWAINLSHSELAHAAITFPWMLGFNTRAAPRLADYVKVFPAASVIFPLEGGSEIGVTRLAFGGGVALANAFTFSAAATVQDTPQAFFLIGVSVPDLVKLP
jgi:hypothetical protein